MNYKIAKTMLILCIVYLVGFYILKFIFPELLIQTISSPTLVRLGEFVNSWKGYEYIIRVISNFIVFYLFACASSGKFKFVWWNFLIILGAVAISTIVIDFLPQFYTHTSIALMFIVATTSNGKLIYATISFTLHGYLSNFLTSIRGFENVITYINPVSGILISLEGLVWLLLLAIIFNIKENKNGSIFTPICK